MRVQPVAGVGLAANHRRNDLIRKPQNAGIKTRQSVWANGNYELGITTVKSMDKMALIWICQIRAY